MIAVRVTMAPFDFAALFGETGGYLVYLAIGFCFGFILESSGFGDSRILAAQFYFRRLNVLKVMFTAIVVAMIRPSRTRHHESRPAHVIQRSQDWAVTLQPTA